MCVERRLCPLCLKGRGRGRGQLHLVARPTPPSPPHSAAPVCVYGSSRVGSGRVRSRPEAWHPQGTPSLLPPPLPFSKPPRPEHSHLGDYCNCTAVFWLRSRTPSLPCPAPSVLPLCLRKRERVKRMNGMGEWRGAEKDRIVPLEGWLTMRKKRDGKRERERERGGVITRQAG